MRAVVLGWLPFRIEVPEPRWAPELVSRVCAAGTARGAARVLIEAGVFPSRWALVVHPCFPVPVVAPGDTAGAERDVEWLLRESREAPLSAWVAGLALLVGFDPPRDSWEREFYERFVGVLARSVGESAGA